MKHATIDKDGRIVGFYDDDLHAKIPTGAIPLTEALYQRWMKGQLTLAWDRKKKKLVPAPTIDRSTSADVRRKRNALLAASDWTQLPDAPLTAKQRKAWADYRQALRDLPPGDKAAGFKFPKEPKR